MMMKDRMKKFHQDNRGGAMAMVLIIIAFISILAGVLMFAAYGGYQMRLVDKQGTDNFYSAETVLDEINAGLQVEVSNALTKSYEQVMVNYAFYETAEKRSKAFYDVYCDELAVALEDSAKPNSYNIETLRSYLTPNVLGDGRPADGLNANGSRTNFGNYGAIVESNADSGAYTMVHQDDGILLKDLKITYVNKSGYVSIISTDIHLVLPAANFSETSAFPGLNNYCLIADETLKMGNVIKDGKVEIKGNAYAGNMLLGKTEDGSLLESDIRFIRADDADPNSLSVVISRGDIEIAESTITTENVELWGENLELKTSKANLQGSTNLKDDLTLSGTGSSAVIAGEYAGFGNAKEAALSSAIVINGKDSYLDLSGLTSMNISGRAYVATAAGKDEQSSLVIQNNTTDVPMGESIAVKSDQIIYMVPPEAIGCDENGVSKFGCNPLTKDQYTELIDPNNADKYVLLDGTKPIAALGNRPLSNYIEKTTVDGSAEKVYAPIKAFKYLNGSAYVYLYLDFESQEKANQYFADYYGMNKKDVDAFTGLYANEIKIANEDSLVYLNLEGNVLRYSESESVGGTLGPEPTETYGVQREKADEISLTKSNIFKALSAKMVTNITELSTAEQGKHAFENIINAQRLEEFVDKFDFFGKGYIQIDTDTAAPKSVILSSGDLVIDSNTEWDSVHMIISLGDVTVKRDFEGLIISAKNIIVEGNNALSIESLTMEDFTEMLLAKEVNGTDEYYVLDVFKDGVNYANNKASIKDVGTETVSMSDLIIYERWSKR